MPTPYRLQTLLEMRERSKEQAEQELGNALKALKEAERKLAALEAELVEMLRMRTEKHQIFMKEALADGKSAMQATTHGRYMDRLKEQEALQRQAIEGQKNVVRQHEAAVVQAQANLVQRSAELQALEKHREKWQAEQKKRREMKEEELLDEMAQSIYLRSEQQNPDDNDENS